MKPIRIFIIRHGESEGNVDKNIYLKKPDYALNLTSTGIEQARGAGGS
jgi:broad specificity phosphatase PhoE